MATCGHVNFIAIPPSFEHLANNFPRIPSHDKIDRSIARCRFCDLADAHLRQQEALSIKNSRAVWKAEKDIKAAEAAIPRGIAKEELEVTLQQLRKKLNDAIEFRDQKIADAWYKHWGIWGPGDIERGNQIYREADETWSTPFTTSSEEEIFQNSAEVIDEISWESDDQEAPLPLGDIEPPTGTERLAKKGPLQERSR